MVSGLTLSGTNAGNYRIIQPITVAHITPALPATIEVHFTYINSILGIPFYHAYILVEQSNRPIIIFRGGPSISNDPNAQSDAFNDFLGLPISSPGFGYLTAAGSDEPFLPGTTDYPEKPGDEVDSFQVPNWRFSYDQIISDFTTSAQTIENLHLQYRPDRQNSNSFAYTLLDKAGLSSPGTPFWTPGWDNILY